MTSNNKTVIADVYKSIEVRINDSGILTISDGYNTDMYYPKNIFGSVLVGLARKLSN